jgi:uncharacterized membrane protein
MIHLLALLIGVVAGMRALTPLAAVSRAACAGALPVHWRTPALAARPRACYAIAQSD